eukprot:gene4947-5746_t
MGFIVKRSIRRQKFATMPTDNLVDTITSRSKDADLSEYIASLDHDGAVEENADLPSIPTRKKLNDEYKSVGYSYNNSQHGIIQDDYYLGKVKTNINKLWNYSRKECYDRLPDEYPSIYCSISNSYALSLQHIIPKPMTEPHLQFLSTLVKLELTHCHHGSIRNIVYPLSQHCPSLEALDLSNTNIRHISRPIDCTDGPLITFKRLSKLTVNQCQGLRDLFVQSSAPLDVYADMCTNLKHIGPTSTIWSISLKSSHISTPTFLLLLANPHIKNLDLSMGLGKQFGEKHPPGTPKSVTRLVLSGCYLSDNGALKYISKCLNGITYLGLDDCQLSDNDIESLSGNLNTVTHLNLSGNDINGKGFDLLIVHRLVATVLNDNLTFKTLDDLVTSITQNHIAIIPTRGIDSHDQSASCNNIFSVVQRPLARLYIGIETYNCRSKPTIDNDRISEGGIMSDLQLALGSGVLEGISSTIGDLELLQPILSRDIFPSAVICFHHINNDSPTIQLSQWPRDIITKLALHVMASHSLQETPLIRTILDPLGHFLRLTELRFIDCDQEGAFTWLLVKSEQDRFFPLLSKSGIQLQSLVMKMCYDPDTEDDDDLDPFHSEMLQYLKSTPSLTTFKYNSMLFPLPILEYLFQSPQCNITQLSINLILESTKFPQITRSNINRLTFDRLGDRPRRKDKRFYLLEPFYRSLSLVKHIKTRICCSSTHRIIGLNSGSESIAMPFFDLLQHLTDPREIGDEIASNTTLLYLYTIHPDVGLSPTEDELDFYLPNEIQEAIDNHPTLINKSTWLWGRHSEARYLLDMNK